MYFLLFHHFWTLHTNGIIFAKSIHPNYQVDAELLIREMKFKMSHVKNGKIGNHPIILSSMRRVYKACRQIYVELRHRTNIQEPLLTYCITAGLFIPAFVLYTHIQKYFLALLWRCIIVASIFFFYFSSQSWSVTCKIHISLCGKANTYYYYYYYCCNIYLVYFRTK